VDGHLRELLERDHLVEGEFPECVREDPQTDLRVDVVGTHERLEEVPLRDGSFDVARFSHTLEHLPSPRRALERAHRVLRPEGRLFIEVPNAASLDRRIFGRHWAGWRLPQHLYHFTPETLARLLVCTGFQPVKITCQGRTAFVVESLLNVVTDRFSIHLRDTKWLSILARPFAYATGMVRRGMILSVHAEKCMGGPAALPARTADRPWCERPG